MRGRSRRGRSIRERRLAELDEFATFDEPSVDPEDEAWPAPEAGREVRAGAAETAETGETSEVGESGPSTRKRGRRSRRGAGRRGGHASGDRNGSDEGGRRGGFGRGRRQEEREPDADPEQVAHAIALQQLTMQPRTRAELERILRRKGLPDVAIDSVLGRLEDVRLIDDEAYAHAWVESRHVGRGLAKKALAHELRKRGVEDEIVGEAVEQLSPERESSTARTLVDKRLRSTRHLEPQARIRRLVGMLARKGYTGAVAYRVVREALEAEGLEDAQDLELLADPPDEEIL